LGSQVGLDSQQTSAFIDRLTLSIDELRRGGGSLFDQLLRIDGGLVRDVASAASSADAIDILARAYARLTDQAQRNTLARAIGGRGGVAGGSLLDAIAGKGGIQAFEQLTEQAGQTIDTALVQRLAKMKTEIEEINRRTSNMWGGAFSEEVLQQQKRSAEFWERIAKAMTQSRSRVPGGVGGPDDWMLPPGQRGADVAAAQAIGPFRTETQLPPWATTVSRPESLAASLELMRRWTAVLGDAITPSEQLAQKQLELAAAQEKGGVSSDVSTRALNAFILAQERVAVATRTQIGIATEEQMLTQRRAELSDLAAKGFIKNAEELVAAEQLVRKEVKETYEAMLVRASATPQLTRLTLDAKNLTKQLDEGLAGALRGSTADMLEMVKGTKTLGEGFASLAQRIADAVLQALLLKSIVGPISGALSGALGNLFPSAQGNVFYGGNVVPFARGGIVSRPTIFPMANGWTGLMGEAGPEAVMPLRRTRSGALGVHSEGGSAPQLFVQVINNSSAQVSTTQESDGRGGRKTVVMIDEAVAGAVGRPGSQTAAALARNRFRARG
jgi:hypothetical protein